MFSNNGYYGQYGMYQQEGIQGIQPEYEPHHNQVLIPQPTGLPWDIRSMSWGAQSPPKLVEFTGHQPPVQSSKRKLQYEPLIPNKQLRTDEAMAAHLNGMHISNDFTSHAKPKPPDDVADRLHPDIEDVKEMAKQGRKIILCEEMRKLKNEPLLPQSLIDKLEKPCMSLVLWKPPPRSSNGPSTSQSGAGKSNNKSETKNYKRGVLVQDLNAMDTM